MLAPVSMRKTRRDELTAEEFGVEAVAIGGPHVVLGTPILGKGHAGVVIRALFEGREVALKARRTDTIGRAWAGRRVSWPTPIIGV